MKSEEFNGKVSQMKTKTAWLASEDFAGLGDVTVQIESIKRHTDVALDAGRKEPELFAVHFKGSEKGMILNATNRKTLSSAFGADTKNWIGQKVKIFVIDGVRKPGGKAGETTTGLRIKAVSSTPNPLIDGRAG
jgi:hypothetical protein